ncbi:MAG: hypothetical protein A2X71_00560 [Thiobacillus sp. GWE1_62_9]|nr:MAG: hypothetical protein A2X71_00560 [Thiobacillus sp. GWE1_62_9]HBU29326.1 hypothetical protein [Thiobacillus sp.]
MLNACYFALPLFLCLPAAEAATLNVTLDGAKAGGGPLTVLVFGGAEGFPREARASARHHLPAGQSTLALVGLKPGQYAVMAYHDEDGNGELNRFLGMIPQEGWGLSNNPAVSGKPAFKDAAITVPESGADVTIRLNY